MNEGQPTIAGERTQIPTLKDLARAAADELYPNVSLPPMSHVMNVFLDFGYKAQDIAIINARQSSGDGETHSEDREQTQPPSIDNEYVAPGCEQFGQSDLQSENLGSERGGMLFNGKTAKEWFGLHEVIRQDYARAIDELEAQDREIKKHEALDRDRLSKLHPQGVRQ